jgi:hypothetical protein
MKAKWLVVLSLFKAVRITDHELVYTTDLDKSPASMTR